MAQQSVPSDGTAARIGAHANRMAAATDETYLHRVVAVLAAFRAEEDAVSPAELARRAGLPKSTVQTGAPLLR